MEPFRRRLHERAREFGIELSPTVLDQFETYFRLLVKWNERMNLTALPLQALDAAGFDRLFLEPLLAASLLDVGSGNWIDVGSGGGSPAIPLKLIRPRWPLVLAEAKARKAAFLREVVRTLGLKHTEVFTGRAEELAEDGGPRFELLTVRAVRFDDILGDAVRRLLITGGWACVFAGATVPAVVEPLQVIATTPLKTESEASIYILECST